MSTKHTPQAGDTVYNAEGEIALYVSTAMGGGYIVQPMIEDGDGVTEPEGYYADGVALWPRVYKEPPQPMLDQAIAEQQARLALLRGEVRQLEQQKREAERDQSALKERLAMHQALAQVFPDVRANAIEIHRRPGLVRQLVDTARAAWRETFRWGW